MAELYHHVGLLSDNSSVYNINTPSTTEEAIPALEIEKDSMCKYKEHITNDSDFASEDNIHCVLRLRGGKGGFGSMLRAIGAQIEKTTNREACRDLSGRRLRDINEEKRLNNWIALQADRERETAERRKKKLERLCAEPKHDFKDVTYEKERAELTDKVSDAVDQGYKVSQAGGSGISQKRKKPSSTATSSSKNKKSCLWIDADEDDFSSSTESDDSVTDKPAAVPKLGPQTVTKDEEVQGGTGTCAKTLIAAQGKPCSSRHLQSSVTQ